MAKAKVTKAKPKAKAKPKKMVAEWQDVIPDRPDDIDLYADASRETIETTIQAWKKEHQSSRPKIRHEQEPYRYHADIFRFVKRMDRSPLSYKEHMLLTSGDGQIFLLNAKRFFCVGDMSDHSGEISLHYIADTQYRTPLGILLTSCGVRNKHNENFASVILINGDQETGDLNELYGIDKCGFPTVSFQCLHRFYGRQSMRTVIKKLTDNVLRVIDYSPDERRPLTARERARLRVKTSQKNRDLNPPEFGFTLVGSRGHEEWHRTGFVLFEDGMMHLLLGQDEDTYFGCELSCSCSSIDEAIRSLVPERLQGRNDLVRQGGWFIVPVKKSEVPAEKDAVLLFDGIDSGYPEGEVYLPLDDPDSIKHFIHGEGRVSRDGNVYVKDCILEHQDHAAAEGGSGWVTFQKNTAVRSFSQQGVD